MSLPFSRDELVGIPSAALGAERSRVGSPRPWEAVVAFFVLAAVFWWTYEEDLRELVWTWQRKADYSHGFLVPPLAVLFLWARRRTFPGLRGPAWSGLLLLVVALALHVGGQWLHLTPLLGWSLILWIAGACWVLGGTRFFLWLLPSIIFLFFMVPLPYQSERLLSNPLQRVATITSTWVLQLADLPAIAQGNTILVESQRFEVVDACSGLRMLLGVGALAFACAIMMRSSWVEKALLLLVAVPVAIAANCIRIVGTAFVCLYLPDDAAKRFTHDVAGLTVIPLAAAMLCLLMAFWRRLVIRMEPVSQARLLRESDLLREPTDEF